MKLISYYFTIIGSNPLPWPCGLDSVGLVIHGDAVLKVVGSNPTCGTIVGVFHPARQLARFMPSIIN